MMFLSVCFDN